MKTEYRLKPDSVFPSFKWLQFKSTTRIFFWKITVWRYVPESWVADVFTERKCPWLYLPFVSSHCYLCFFEEEKAKEWVDKNPEISQHLKNLKEKHQSTTLIKYL